MWAGRHRLQKPVCSQVPPQKVWSSLLRPGLPSALASSKGSKKGVRIREEGPGEALLPYLGEKQDSKGCQLREVSFFREVESRLCFLVRRVSELVRPRLVAGGKSLVVRNTKVHSSSSYSRQSCVGRNLWVAGR